LLFSFSTETPGPAWRTSLAKITLLLQHYYWTIVCIPEALFYLDLLLYYCYVNLTASCCLSQRWKSNCAIQYYKLYT